MEDITDSENAKVATIAELMSAQSTGSDCCTNSALVGKQNTRFNVYSDRALVRVFSLDSATQKVAPATLRTQLLNLCH